MKQTFFLDVRTQEEHARSNIPGDLNISSIEIQNHLTDLPMDKTILIYCRSGKRAEYTKHILLAKGFQAENVGTVEAARKLHD